MFRRVLIAAAVGVLCVPATAQAQDACPNGWSPEANVEFAPPVPAVDSGVQNVEGRSGCTLLDDIWAREPFSDHAALAAVSTTNTPEVAGHGRVWPAQASDPIPIR